MAIEELIAVVAPPECPLELGDEDTWRLVERQMKTKFPIDYWDLIRTYGSGLFAFGDHDFVKIYNPFSRLFESDVLDLCENYLGFREEEGRKAYPYKVHPTKGGIFPLGVDSLESNELYWITARSPDPWRLLLRSAENECEEFDGPLTTFLAKAFS